MGHNNAPTQHIFHRPHTPDFPPSASIRKRTPKNEDGTKSEICKNRECNKASGYSSKPNSIYCSSRCQSREQNLRQGRVKNVRKLPGPEKNLSPIKKKQKTPKKEVKK